MGVFLWVQRGEPARATEETHQGMGFTEQ